MISLRLFHHLISITAAGYRIIWTLGYGCHANSPAHHVTGMTAIKEASGKAWQPLLADLSPILAVAEADIEA